jgi:hypothetical protein
MGVLRLVGCGVLPMGAGGVGVNLTTLNRPLPLAPPPGEGDKSGGPAPGPKSEPRDGPGAGPPGWCQRLGIRSGGCLGGE